jgi:hypothetical protein
MIFALLLLATYGLVNMFGRSEVMAADATATKSEVLKYIPIGTSIVEAQSFMAREGFKCFPMKNQKFADHGSDNKQISMGPADILYCDSGERLTWSILISKRWQVIFQDDAGKVAYVAVDVGLTGL